MRGLWFSAWGLALMSLASDWPARGQYNDLDLDIIATPDKRPRS